MNHFHILQFSLTDKCNLRCLHCPKGPESEAPTMSIQDFKRYLSKFNCCSFERLLLSDFGESTIISDFIEYLRYARSLGWKQLAIVTNGTFLNQRFWEEVIVEQLLTHVQISIESADSQTYAEIRGTSFERFVKFTTMLKELRQKYSSDMRVAFNVTCMRRNLHELPSIVRLANDMDIRQIFFVNLAKSTLLENSQGEYSLRLMEQHLDTLPRWEIVQIFRKICEMAYSWGISIFYPENYPEVQRLAADLQSLKEKIGLIWDDPPTSKETDPRLASSRCPYPYRWVQVNQDGSIYPCCQISRRYSVGNLDFGDFNAIWNSPEVVSFLNQLQEGNVPLQVCQECNVLNNKNY